MSIVKRIRQRGILHLLETLFNRVVPASVFRFSAGRVLDLDLDQLLAASPAADDQQYRFRRVSGDAQRDALRQTTYNSVPIQWAADDHGYAVCRADLPDDFVGGVWGGHERFIEADLGFEIQLEPQQAWLYCAYLDKSMRGQGVYKRLLSFAAKDLCERGFKQLCVIIQPWNHASMAVHQKYATRVVGHIAVLRVFKLSLVFTSGDVSRDRFWTTHQTDQPVQVRITENL